MSDTRVATRPYVVGPTSSFFVVPSGYTPNAVNFDTTAINRRAGLAGVSNGKTGLISCWLKNPNAASLFRRILFLANGVGDTTFYISGGGFATFVGGNVAGTAASLSYRGNSSFASMTSWVHVLFSWNMTTPGRTQIKINGADDPLGITVTTLVLDDTLTYNTGITLGANDANGDIFGATAGANIADLQAWFGATASPVDIDLSTPSNVAAFFNSGAVNPTVGAALVGRPPDILFSSAGASWGITNNGTGGDFAVISGTISATTFAYP